MCLNVHPNNQSHTKCGHLCFVACYTVLQMSLQGIQLLWKTRAKGTRESISCYHKSILCVISKKSWRTKVSPWYCTYWVDKKARLDIKQWKNQAFSLIHCWVRLGWRYQLVSRKFSWIGENFFKNLLEGFRVNLKTFFAYPNNPILPSWKFEDSDFLGKKELYDS